MQTAGRWRGETSALRAPGSWRVTRIRVPAPDPAKQRVRRTVTNTVTSDERATPGVPRQVRRAKDPLRTAQRPLRQPSSRAFVLALHGLPPGPIEPPIGTRPPGTSGPVGLEP